MPPHNLINVESGIILGSEACCLLVLGRPKQIPLQIRNFNHLSETTRLKVLRLNMLTIGTPSHILSNVLLNSIKAIDLLEVMIHLGGTWMYRILGTMGLYNYLSSQIIDVWYTHPILVPKYVVISQSRGLIDVYQH
ncbi:hypothetical protein EJD97_021294 [Solanum chilense]|uniref:Uncharacterized protein n=1 Tax=Solanum chilense TaxID=4083 RepID=A0A6N2C791_SOLCI|nr:hypothetical protein EJD97_021294 [Solanum chilense]